MPHGCGPTQALDFPRRCAAICIDAVKPNSAGNGKSAAGMPSARSLRAIDVGCSVGGITFELTRGFDEVVGVDYSRSFVQAAKRMRLTGRCEYQCLEQGNIVVSRTAYLPPGTIPSRARFEEGDACALDLESLGSFDAVLASNLLCRLPKPKAFLGALPALVKPGGVAVLISPYSWLPEYTHPEEWLGGFREGGEGGAGRTGGGDGASEGTIVDSFETIKYLLEAGDDFKLEKRMEMPFLIREHARKFQWGCSDGTIWRRASATLTTR